VTRKTGIESGEVYSTNNIGLHIVKLTGGSGQASISYVSVNRRREGRSLGGSGQGGRAQVLANRRREGEESWREWPRW
jgi:hypothetical protein